MATFPALNPQGRTYTAGSAPSTQIPVLNGDEGSVRHSNKIVGDTLRLLFRGLTTAQHYEIVSHFNLHGRFLPFDLPTETLKGSDLTFPAGYLWIYVGTPQTIYLPDVIEITLELELVPPYTI